MNLTPDPLLALCTRLPDLRLSAGHPEPGWCAWADLGGDGPAIEEALHRQAEFEPGLDRRGQAAFLAGLLGYRLGMVAEALRLSRLPIDLGRAELHLLWETWTWEHEGATGQANRALLRTTGGEGEALEGEALRRALVDRLAPPLLTIALATGLGPGALWRQAADGIAMGALEAGRALGQEEEAVAHATALLRAPGSPLTNRQWGFLFLTVSDERGRCLSERFVERGGCCRWFTVPGAASEGDPGYCTTCVMRRPDDRRARLEDWLRERLAATA